MKDQEIQTLVNTIERIMRDISVKKVTINWEVLANELGNGYTKPLPRITIERYS